jgi:hypothetical protein
MSNWIDPWRPEVTLTRVKEISRLLSELGGPLTKGLSDLISAEKYIDVVKYNFDYNSGYSLRDYQCARSVHSLLQKQEWMDLGIDTDSVGRAKFWEMEERCRVWNEALGERRLTADAWRVVHRARLKIASILGPVPPLSRLKASFGPGATTGVKSRLANPLVKLASSLACSRELLPFVGDFLAEVPLWAWSKSGGSADFINLGYPVGEHELSFFPSIEVHDGKMSLVPKDARSKRPIIVEPILNGFFQLGVGRYLKERMLRSVDLNLSDQSRNQRLAMQGSIHGGYATIDLSSASDCVSRGLVELLLPWDWYEFLAKLVTSTIREGNKVSDLHKFSSMGNGFTFELESLIFYSVTKATTELLDLAGEVSVFGDDIICNSRAYSLLTAVLSELGFIVNNEKSFSSGPFRESCGADWFEGQSIRPYYAKKAWSERTLYTFHNWAVRNCEHELASLLFSYTQPSLRLFGPDGFGDGHLLGSYSLRLSRKYRRRGWEGGFFDTYSLRPNRLKKRSDMDWVYPSYSVYTRSGERDPTDPDIVRGSNGYAKVSLYTLARSIFGS